MDGLKLCFNFTQKLSVIRDVGVEGKVPPMQAFHGPLQGKKGQPRGVESVRGGQA